MGLFKSEEEKAAKAEEKIAKLMAKYHLEDVSPKYANSVKEISSDLVGAGIGEAGVALGMNYKTEDMLKIQYLKAIMHQNWIIIRLLDDIVKK